MTNNGGRRMLCKDGKILKMANELNIDYIVRAATAARNTPQQTQDPMVSYKAMLANKNTEHGLPSSRKIINCNNNWQYKPIQIFCYRWNIHETFKKKLRPHFSLSSNTWWTSQWFQPKTANPSNTQKLCHYWKMGRTKHLQNLKGGLI